MQSSKTRSAPLRTSIQLSIARPNQSGVDEMDERLRACVGWTVRRVSTLAAMLLSFGAYPVLTDAASCEDV